MKEPIVNMKKISKSFPGVQALDEVDFSLYSGEVVALMGENGAGKSTLMKILSGIYPSDEGTIEVFGEDVSDMTPNRARELGISIIHQELNMCGDLTVTENIFLGREIRKKGFIDTQEMTRQTQKYLDKLSLDIKPSDLVGTLPVSKQQMVEICKALSMDSKILIMDEPTSALTAKEIEDLFEIIKNLRSEGQGIIYISHRLSELEEIVDRVVIMRDGQYITSNYFKNLTIPKIISYMVGREIKEQFPYQKEIVKNKIFEVKNLNSDIVKDISFSLYEGEIVGISGLMGAGRTELTRTIFGIDRKLSGEITLDGKNITINRPENAIKEGIVLVPEDRKRDGLCTKLSIQDNITLPNLDMVSNRLGIIDSDNEKKLIDSTIKKLRIKAPNSLVNADSLSGGNQQKIVVGKWLARNSRVVIFDEPTRGIDVAAKVEIYNIMNQLKKEGIGVLFVSSELPEVLGMSDRVLVMCDGRMTGELSREEATQDKVLTLATQFKKKLKTEVG